MPATRRTVVSEFDACPCAGATLDKLIQPAILTVLARQDLHGYRIAERLAQMPPFRGHKPDVSGVYRFLRAIEERGLVVASWDVSRRGPAKRLYALTPAGRDCLSRWIDTLDHYREAIGDLLALGREAVAAAGTRPRGSASESGTAQES